MDPSEQKYRRQRVNGLTDITSKRTDYYVGEVAFADIQDAPRRQCCLLCFSCVEKATEQENHLGKFSSNENIANCYSVAISDKDEDGVLKGSILLAVTKFEKTLKEIANNRILFWKYKTPHIFGSQDNFREFLVILTKLAYCMSEKELFLDDSDILASVAFGSADLKSPLVIRLAPACSNPGKPMLPYLTSISNLLDAILIEQEAAYYPELRHFKSLLSSEYFWGRNSEGLLLRHPALLTPEEKKDLIRYYSNLWNKNRSLGEKMSSKSVYELEFKTWKNKIEKKDHDYRKKADAQKSDLVGLVRFARNVFSHIRDGTNHSRVFHTDGDIVDMLLKVSPNLFIELYRCKEALPLEDGQAG